MANVKIDGLDKLQKHLKWSVELTDVKRVVSHNAAELQRKAQENAPVGTPESTGIKGYVGGTLKRSIELDIKDAGFTGEVEPKAEYAGYVEYGTRFMEPKPYMGPAYKEQKAKFKQDLKMLMR